MTPAATRLTHAVMIVAALAAIVIVAPLQAAPAPSQQTAVVVLPTVAVTARRANFAPAPVVQMPKVTVTGRRLERSDGMQARRDDARPSPAALTVARCEDATVRC